MYFFCSIVNHCWITWLYCLNNLHLLVLFTSNLTNSLLISVECKCTSELPLTPMKFTLCQFESTFQIVYPPDIVLVLIWDKLHLSSSFQTPLLPSDLQLVALIYSVTAVPSPWHVSKYLPIDKDLQEAKTSQQFCVILLYGL